MNVFVKEGLIFVGGLVLGATGSGLFFKFKFDKIYDEDSKKLDKYYRKKYATLKLDTPRRPVEKIPESKGPIIEESFNSKARDRVLKNYTRYSSMFRDVEVDRAELEHPEDDSEQVEKKKGVRFIKETDFGSEPGYSKQELLYYVDSGDLTVDEEQNEELIKDADEISSRIGDALTANGFKHNDDVEVVFVRNYDRECDYSIRKVYGPYTP